MAQVKLTKNELKNQQLRLREFNKYLPTLQLKKALLQLEVASVRALIDSVKLEFQAKREEVKKFASLLSSREVFELLISIDIDSIDKGVENIAGIEVPLLESVNFKEISYSLFTTPPWLDPATKILRTLLELRERVIVAEERKRLIEKELREVSIRVNLFEKILIPRATENIRRIKIFLGDQQLAAVAQAKVAKMKIEERKKEVSQ